MGKATEEAAPAAIAGSAEASNSCSGGDAAGEIKELVNAAWEKLNPGAPFKMPNFMNKSSSSANKKKQKTTPNWMASFGLAPKKPPASRDVPEKNLLPVQSGSSEEARRMAAAALSAVRESAASSLAGAGKGKVEQLQCPSFSGFGEAELLLCSSFFRVVDDDAEISEVREFAGEEIEIKKLVDAESAEAAKAQGTPTSALDNILEHIKKKPKVSVLDKTRKDWGEFKEEKGIEDELETYKKSSGKYLDKVSFLQRTDLREFERERDARLSMQAKRKADTHEDDN